jgi:hypothetical protein
MTSSKFRCTVSDQLRAARRTRPTQDAFAKELALDACASALAAGRLSAYEATAIRLALEAQPD